MLPHSSFIVPKFLLQNAIDSFIVLQILYLWRFCMEAVKISPKYQVVIPKKLRKTLNLTPGQQVQMIAFEDRIEMIPVRQISEMKGFLKGIDTTLERESGRI
jgi:AbrB family looped-hinge helix DNA binding protein